jgi:hypothetical protein
MVINVLQNGKKTNHHSMRKGLHPSGVRGVGGLFTPGFTGGY